MYDEERDKDSSNNDKETVSKFLIPTDTIINSYTSLLY